MQEAKQALELMGRWEKIDVCDALELLSPVFESEEVGGLCMLLLVTMRHYLNISKHFPFLYTTVLW